MKAKLLGSILLLFFSSAHTHADPLSYLGRIGSARKFALKMVRSVGQKEILSDCSGCVAFYSYIRQKMIDELNQDLPYSIAPEVKVKEDNKDADKDACTGLTSKSPTVFSMHAESDTNEDLAQLWIHEIMHHLGYTHETFDYRITMGGARIKNTPSIFDEIPKAIVVTYKAKGDSDRFYNDWSIGKNRLAEYNFQKNSFNNVGAKVKDVSMDYSWISGYHDCKWKSANPIDLDFPKEIIYNHDDDLVGVQRCLKIDIHDGHRLRVLFRKDESKYYDRFKKFIFSNDMKSGKFSVIHPIRPGIGENNNDLEVMLVMQITGTIWSQLPFTHSWLRHWFLYQYSPYPLTRSKDDEYEAISYELNDKFMAADENTMDLILSHPEYFKPHNSEEYGQGYIASPEVIYAYSPIDAFYFSQLNIEVTNPSEKYKISNGKTAPEFFDANLDSTTDP